MPRLRQGVFQPPANDLGAPDIVIGGISVDRELYFYNTGRVALYRYFLEPLCVSVNTAVAIRIGAHRITYQPNFSGEPDPSGLQLRIDGKPTPLEGRELLLPSGGRILRTAAQGGIQIAGGTVLVITPVWWDHYKVLYLNVDVRQARATEGVMGAFAPGSWLPALPDGTSLGPQTRDLNQRYQDLYVTFANAWRVTDATSLFDYTPGASTSTFALVNWPGQAPKSCILPQEQGRLPASLPRNHWPLMTEQIARNAVPGEPVLTSPEDFTADLVERVRFTWNKAVDSDGDPLTYRHCVWDAAATLTFANCPTVSGGTPWWPTGIDSGRAIVLIALLLLLLLVAIAYRRKPVFAVLVAVAILAAVIVTLYTGRPAATVSTTVAQLDSGKAYFWKVIVEDSKGGSMESETRRFAMR